MQRIVSEAKCSLTTSGIIAFRSTEKHHQYKKPVNDLDACNKIALRRIIFYVYGAGEFPTAQKLVIRIKEAAGFQGSEY